MKNWRNSEDVSFPREDANFFCLTDLGQMSLIQLGSEIFQDKVL